MATTPDCVRNFWPTFGDSDLTEVTCDAVRGSIASDVLDKFNIPSTHSSRIGGNLENLDIKAMDAMAAINLSLLETLADDSFSSGFYEPIVNAEGEVEFIEIGNGTADLSPIYHKIQSSSYVEDCSGVLIRGGTTLPEWKELDWKQIWGDGTSKKIYDTTDFRTGCLNTNYSTHAVITFDNPHLTTAYNDGIDNLFNIDNPYDRLLGYVNFIHSPNKTKNTRIEFRNTTIVPIKVGTSPNPDMGTLFVKPVHGDIESILQDPDCWTNFVEADQSSEGGVPIIIDDSLRFEDKWNNKIDKFVKVEKVLIKGYALDLVSAGPKDGIPAGASPTNENTEAVISFSNTIEDIFELDEGKHYIISYEGLEIADTFKRPYIVFSKNARINEPKTYGKGTNYKISNFGDFGVLHGGETGVATIFPVAENKGYLVTEIIAMIQINSPCIEIYDPESDFEHSKAIDIAHRLEYWISPIMVYEPDPPVGYNGSLLDQTEIARDFDPTTAQDFTNTPYELAMDDIRSGSGVELTLPFLNGDDEDKIKNLSGNLYDVLNSGNGIETNYVCGPGADPKLGDRGPSGGVINNITYSYTDSGSYTISVNEGARLIKPFSGGGPTGPSPKMTSSPGAKGVVIDSIGNGMFFKVRLDGIGERIAINMADTFVRVNDIVTCTVNNNSVEV